MNFDQFTSDLINICPLLETVKVGGVVLLTIKIMKKINSESQSPNSRSLV